MKQRLRLYTDLEFDQLAEMIDRVPGNQLNRESLLRALHALLLSTGMNPGYSSVSRYWAESAGDTVRPAEKAALLFRAAKAANPIDPDTCVGEIRPDVNGHIRNRWSARWKRQGRAGEPFLRNIVWDQLAPKEQSEIRQMLRELAELNRSLVRRGPKPKNTLDTLMLGLAEIWIGQSRSSGHIMELPYSRNSRFIQFVAIALRPIARDFECSRASLSRRWERMVRVYREA